MRSLPKLQKILENVLKRRERLSLSVDSFHQIVVFFHLFSKLFRDRTSFFFLCFFRDKRFCGSGSILGERARPKFDWARKTLPSTDWTFWVLWPVRNYQKELPERERMQNLIQEITWFVPFMNLCSFSILQSQKLWFFWFLKLVLFRLKNALKSSSWRTWNRYGRVWVRYGRFRHDGRSPTRTQRIPLGHQPRR